MASTGISISMRDIRRLVTGKDFAALAGTVVSVPGQKAFKLDATAQVEVLVQGIYRYLYLPQYSKTRSANRTADREAEQARWDALERAARKRGMTDAEIAAIKEGK